LETEHIFQATRYTPGKWIIITFPLISITGEEKKKKHHNYRLSEGLRASLPPCTSVQTFTTSLVTVYKMFYTEKIPKIALPIINCMLYVYLFIKYSSPP